MKNITLSLLVCALASISLNAFAETPASKKTETKSEQKAADKKTDEKKTEETKNKKTEIKKDKKGMGDTAILKTSMGTITVKLFKDEAPKTVENFVGLATGTKEWTNPTNGEKMKGKSLYNGTIFHRVIKDFMIQGGDPLGQGIGGPGYKFADETEKSTRKFDKPGILAMANAGPNTNGSQFFITVVPTAWLTGKHTIFGEVTSGMDVVMKISTAPTGAMDRPNPPIKLESVTIE